MELLFGLGWVYVIYKVLQALFSSPAPKKKKRKRIVVVGYRIA
jgi:hypothetical protein